MGVESNKTVVRRYYDGVLNADSLGVIDRLAVENYARTTPSWPGQQAVRPQAAGGDAARGRSRRARSRSRTLWPKATALSRGGAVAALIQARSWACRPRTTLTRSPGSTSTGSPMDEWPSTGTWSTSSASCSSSACSRTCRRDLAGMATAISRWGDMASAPTPLATNQGCSPGSWCDDRRRVHHDRRVVSAGGRHPRR